jgi:hypothetical protein
MNVYWKSSVIQTTVWTRKQDEVSQVMSYFWTDHLFRGGQEDREV